MRFNSDFDVIKGEDIYLQIAEHNPRLTWDYHYKYGIYLDDGTLVGNITVRIGHNFHFSLQR